MPLCLTRLVKQTQLMSRRLILLQVRAPEYLAGPSCKHQNKRSSRHGKENKVASKH